MNVNNVTEFHHFGNIKRGHQHQQKIFQFENQNSPIVFEWLEFYNGLGHIAKIRKDFNTSLHGL